MWEARLYAEAIVESVRDPLLILDARLLVRSVNAPFLRLFAVPLEQVLNHALADLDPCSWGTQGLADRLLEVLRSGEPMGVTEVTYASPTHGLRTLLVDARRLHRDGEPADLVLLSLHDETERRHAREILRDAQELHRDHEIVHRRQRELHEASRKSTVGELAAGLAHELNQPLSTINFLVETCANYVRGSDLAPPRLLALLGDVAEASMRAAGIVAHLRSFVERGEARLEACDLGEIVGNIPRLLRRDLEALDVRLRVDLSAPSIPILADRIQVEQVLVNLLQNAADSIQEAGSSKRWIDLDARVRRGTAEVRVRDTGGGITSHAAERMFRPFFTTKPQGLGMGLALSRSIVEAHRGRIWHEEPPGNEGGTVFCFTIPIRSARRRRRKDPPA